MFGLFCQSWLNKTLKFLTLEGLISPPSTMDHCLGWPPPPTRKNSNLNMHVVFRVFLVYVFGCFCCPVLMTEFVVVSFERHGLNFWMSLMAPWPFQPTQTLRPPPQTWTVHKAIRQRVVDMTAFTWTKLIDLIANLGCLGYFSGMKSYANILYGLW